MSFIARTSIARPLFRSALRQAPVAASLLQRRQVASTVSGRPGSQTLPHAAQNVKEEVGNTVGDLARSLGGGALNVGAITGESGFAGVTGAVAATVPKPVMAFGLAGALPYLGTSLSTLYLARQAGNAAASSVSGVDPSMMLAALDSCLNVQVTYGAVLLSFLGALHWGMEFAGYGGHHGAKRLMLGAAPVLVAWPTLMLEPTTAIVAQWLAFTALWGADHRVTAWGWTPKWYSQYRFYLSILIGTCMIGTLAGNAYFGPVAGHSFATTDLERMRNERHRLRKENAGEIKGDIEALPAQEESDSFVMIRKKPEEDKPEVKKADGGKS